MPTYIRWFWPQDRRWRYEELDDEYWPIRHVEVDEGGNVVAAASLEEVVAARDSGVTWAVGLYETVYGVVPQGPFPPGPDGDVQVPVAEFQTLWERGRIACSAQALDRASRFRREEVEQIPALLRSQVIGEPDEHGGAEP